MSGPTSTTPRPKGPGDRRQPDPNVVAIWLGPFKGSRGPFKGPRGPFKWPRDSFKGHRGPFNRPRGPLKGPRGPLKWPRVPFKGPKSVYLKAVWVEMFGQAFPGVFGRRRHPGHPQNAGGPPRASKCTNPYHATPQGPRRSGWKLQIEVNFKGSGHFL